LLHRQCNSTPSLRKAYETNALEDFSGATSYGDIQITLTWDSGSDMDLWVFDPGGEWIGYANPTSVSGGHYEVDDTDGFGPENTYWPYGTAPTGDYYVEVDHISGDAPVYYMVLVQAFGWSQTFSGTLGVEQTAEVVLFTVSGFAAEPAPGGVQAFSGPADRPRKSATATESGSPAGAEIPPAAYYDWN